MAVSAQDKALAALCVERGLLDDASIERASAAHARARAEGEAPPLGQFLVQGGFLDPKLAAGLLRELSTSTYQCPNCPGRAWTYETLASLARYRCDQCGQRLSRSVRPSSRTGTFVVPVVDQTERQPHARAPISNDGAPVHARAAARASGAFNTPGQYPPSGAYAAAPGFAGSGPYAIPHGSGAVPVAPGMPAPGVPIRGSSSFVVPASPRSDDAGSQRGLERKIGPYTVLSELGRGAMGVVYLAKRPGLDRFFALKVMMGGAFADQEAIARFKREAQVASRLEHPAIVSVSDLGQDGDYHYYAMEYCPGRTLQQLIKEEGKQQPRRAAELIMEVARGAGVAHRMGVVHRDLKPANVIIDQKTGKPRITDFGLARDLSSQHLNMTRTGDLIGTPSYMAPEQLVGKKDVDARADVYALGVLLFELLSGERPYHADTIAHLAARVLTEEPKKLSSIADDVPGPLKAIVGKALSRNVDARYADAGDMADDLERFLNGKAVRAAGQADSKSGEVATAPPERSRGALAIALVALAVVVAAGTGTFLFLKMRADDQRREQATREREARTKRVRELDDEAAKGADHEGLAIKFEELRKKPVPGTQAALELTWARILARRGRFQAAEAAATPFLAAPGADGLAARRVVVEALASHRDRDEQTSRRLEELLAPLEQSTDASVLAWAKLQRAALDPTRAASISGKDALAQSEDPGVLRLLAQLELRNEKNAEALKSFERTLRRASDDAVALIGRVALRRGAFDPASPPSEALRTDLRRDVNAFFSFAGAEGEKNADALFERALLALWDARWGDLVRDLDDAIELGLESLDAHRIRSWIPDEAGMKSAKRAHGSGSSPLEPRDAINLCGSVTRALEERLRATAATAAKAAQPELEKALVASARGEPIESVLERFARADRAAPEDPVVLLERARCLLSRGRTREARTELARLRKLGKVSPEALLLEHEVHDRVGRRVLAGQVADELARADRDGWCGLIARAWLARAQDRTDEAKQLLETAIKKAPNEAAPRRELALVILPSDAARAEQLAREAIAREARFDMEGFRVAFLAFFAKVRQNPMGSMLELMKNARPGTRPDREQFAKLLRMGDDVTDLSPCPHNWVARAKAAWWFADIAPPSVEFCEAFLGHARDAEQDGPIANEFAGQMLCDLAFSKSPPDRNLLDRALRAWTKARELDPDWTIPEEQAKRLREPYGSVFEKLLPPPPRK